MATLSENLDPDVGARGKNRALSRSYIAFIELGHIMHAIDLVNAF